ncbi:glycoside hydrolase family 2 TIM barrel-domain containing protein [Wenyingzhuangia sp. IMCC45533]
MKISINKFLLIIICAFASTSCKSEENAEVKQGKFSINKEWVFKKLSADETEADFELEKFNDKEWEKVSLPHTANIEPTVVNNQWQGICWYRKKLTVDTFDSSKKYLIEFEAAMNVSKVWINGKLATTHQGGYLPVVIDVSKFLKRGDNTIAVRLDNTDNPVTGPKPLKILDFNTFGGLYRNAWLIVKDNVYISHAAIADKVAGGGVFITYPKVSKDESTIKIKTNVVNENIENVSIAVENVISYDGNVVKTITSELNKIDANKDIDITTEVTLKNVNLWSPAKPNLYTVETRIYKDNKIVDAEEHKIGIREFTFKENQLYINGVQTFLRGVNRHQEYPFVGYAMSDNAQYRDAKKIKDGGFNYIRLSHYPQSPAFMDACDELGIVVIDAILGWQYYADNDDFRGFCYNSAKQLIRRDRNRPSVLAWEVSLNETKMPVFFMEKLNEIVHQEYPGDNVYSCGWMDDVYDIYLQARQHRILHPHELKENQPYSVSEYGDWEYYSKNAGLNQDALPNNLRDEFSSRQVRAYGEERLLRQANNVQEAHNDNLTTKAYSDSYWVMYDYNRGYHDKIEESGLMDLFRYPKFAYYFYQSQRNVDDGMVLKIASYWNEKSPLNLKVYSNCDEVALYLDGKLLAKQKPDANKNTTKLNHPPFTFNLKKYKAGTLKAVGFIDGDEVTTTEVTTPGKPESIVVIIDESGKAPISGANDVVFAYISIVDKNGTVVPNYTEAVNVNVKGNASIVNIDPIKTEAGVASVLLKIGDSATDIELAINSKNLKTTHSFKVDNNE